MENLVRKENRNYQKNSNIWHVGTSTVNASVKADALSATTKTGGVIHVAIYQAMVILEETETDLKIMYKLF